MSARRRLVLVVAILLGIAGSAGPIAIVLGAARGESAFGDSETFGLNQVSSASVSIDVGANTLPIDTSRLAPGDRVTGQISFENDGTLPLRYALIAEFGDSTGVSLLDVLEWRIWPVPDGAPCSSTPRSSSLLFAGIMRVEQVLGDARVGADPGDRVLLAGATDVLCVDVRVPIEIGDGYQAADAVVHLVVQAEQAPEEAR
jgi:hypothetical protein